MGCPTVGSGSGHDLMVHEFEPYIGLCTVGAKPAWDSLSPSPSAPPLHSLSLSLSLKINKLEKITCKLKILQTIDSKQGPVE